MYRLLLVLLFVGCTASDPFAPSLTEPTDTVVGQWVETPNRQLACTVPVNLATMPDSMRVRSRTPWPLNDGTLITRELAYRISDEGVAEIFETRQWTHYDARAFSFRLRAFNADSVSFERYWHCAAP